MASNNKPCDHRIGIIGSGIPAKSRWKLEMVDFCDKVNQHIVTNGESDYPGQYMPFRYCPECGRAMGKLREEIHEYYKTLMHEYARREETRKRLAGEDVKEEGDVTGIH